MKTDEEMTPELEEAFDRYKEVFGRDPDTYAEVDYEMFDDEEFIRRINKAIKKKVEFPKVCIVWGSNPFIIY